MDVTVLHIDPSMAGKPDMPNEFGHAGLDFLYHPEPIICNRAVLSPRVNTWKGVVCARKRTVTKTGATSSVAAHVAWIVLVESHQGWKCRKQRWQTGL